MAFDLNAAAVQLNQAPREEKAKTCSRDSLGVLPFKPLILAEQARALVGVHSKPFVRDNNPYSALKRLPAQQNRSAVGRILDRVAQKVGYDLVDFILIDLYFRQAFVQPDVQFMVRRPELVKPLRATQPLEHGPKLNHSRVQSDRPVCL